MDNHWERTLDSISIIIKGFVANRIYTDSKEAPWQTASYLYYIQPIITVIKRDRR
jgi:hypothetical protein